MAAKKTTLPASTKKKAQPVMPSKPGKRPAPGSGADMPPWMAKPKKASAVKRTPRKAGGK